MCTSLKVWLNYLHGENLFSVIRNHQNSHWSRMNFPCLTVMMSPDNVMHMKCEESLSHCGNGFFCHSSFSCNWGRNTAYSVWNADTVLYAVSTKNWQPSKNETKSANTNQIVRHCSQSTFYIFIAGKRSRYTPRQINEDKNNYEIRYALRIPRIVFLY